MRYKYDELITILFFMEAMHEDEIADILKIEVVYVRKHIEETRIRFSRIFSKEQQLVDMYIFQVYKMKRERYRLNDERAENIYVSIMELTRNP